MGEVKAGVVAAVVLAPVAGVRTINADIADMVATGAPSQLLVGDVATGTA